MTKLAVLPQDSNSRIQAKVAALRSLSVADVIGRWHLDSSGEDGPGEDGPGEDGQFAPLNEKGQIVWSRGRQSLELVQWIVLTDLLALDLMTDATKIIVRLGLTWWAEKAEVWVAGVLVQEGDLFDHTCRVVLPVLDIASPVEVRLKLVSPGHDIGALMRSSIILEAADGGIDAGFVADEVEIVRKFLMAFCPEDLELLADRLDDLMDLTDLKAIESVLCHWSDRIKQYKIQCLGHAHLDLAWLWTVDETWEVAERTFVSALNLMKDFPKLIFGHTTPVLYEWFEQNRPEIFAEIQTRIQSGQWEAIGGLWVEPELNLIGGESIARQILYGQRYYDQKFGAISRVAWLPDTFGFCGQLPQFFQLGGIDYFVTQKLRWNDTNKYPHEVFDWVAPDGSTVLALMSAPIGEWVDPIKMSDYCWDFATRSGLQTCLYLPGVGDHGGGPTRDMLEIAKRWETSAVFPTIEFTTAERFLDSIPLTPLIRGDRSVDEIVDNTTDLEQSKVPLTKGDLGASSHHGEIYLEFHRGCYTTHADQKAYNRDGENALYEAELWASIAALTVGFNYPKSELEKTWKKVLFNQFHDILPGTSIREVYPKANRFWDRVLIDTDCIINNAKERIISMIALPEAPHPEARLIVVFNPNNWNRSQFVSFLLSAPPTQALPTDWQVQTVEGEALASHSVLKQTGEGLICIVSAIVPDVPALGYACYWAVPSDVRPEIEPVEGLEIYCIENDYLKVEISGKTGNITSMFDKKNQREVLRDDGNELQSFADESQYWDAWNINPKYQDFPLPSAKLFDIHYVASNLLRSRIEVTRIIGRSTFTQTYSLTKHSPILEIKHYIDWQEKHVLVKMAFPLNLEADFVTYESACGVVDRTTRPQTPEELAMWEVSGLRWASLSDGDYGVSILSDRKHGYDHKPNEIRISLLRAPEFPDPIADEGIHEFTIGIYPHAGNWKTADTPKRAIELSLPLQAIVPNERMMQGLLPTSMSLISLQAEHFMLMAIKRSEDHGNQYVLRGYEYYGEGTEIAIGNSEIVQSIQLGDRVNLLEQSLEPQSNQINAWTIASFKLTH